MNNYTKEMDNSYCLGMSLTVEALLHKVDFVSEVVLSNKAEKNHQLDKLLSLCNDNNIPYRYDDTFIEKLSLKENCYCIGIFNKYDMKLRSDNHIVLYEFNDYGELGTILRSAVSFDFKDIVLVNCDLDYFDPRCIRASMGSIFHCNIEKYDSLDDYLNQYQHNLYPFSGKKGKELSSLVLKKPYSIIIGQDYHSLDNIFENTYYIDHNGNQDISLSIRSTIILEKAFHLKRSL